MSANIATDTGGGDRGLWLQLFPEDLARLIRDRDTFTKYLYPLACWHMGEAYDPPEGVEADFIFGKLQDQQRRSAQSQQAKRDGAKQTNEKRWGNRERVGSESVATRQRPSSDPNTDTTPTSTQTSIQTRTPTRQSGEGVAAPVSVFPSAGSGSVSAFGDAVSRAAALLHGKPCPVWHDFIAAHGENEFWEIAQDVADNPTCKRPAAVFTTRLKNLLDEDCGECLKCSHLDRKARRCKYSHKPQGKCEFFEP